MPIANCSHQFSAWWYSYHKYPCWLPSQYATWRCVFIMCASITPGSCNAEKGEAGYRPLAVGLFLNINFSQGVPRPPIIFAYVGKSLSNKLNEMLF